MEKLSNIRVGVLTFHNGPNFGGVLQAWHMVHAIRALGYTCHAVNYLHSDHHRNNAARIPISSISSLKARVFWILKRHGFRNFEKSICRHEFTDRVDQVPWDDFDIFVVGSDVIWNYQQASWGSDPVYYGMIPGLKGKPMISYAASCGPSPPSGPFPDHVAEGLEQFVAIGVRDTATAELVKNASGRDTTLVIDPTWLGPEPVSDWKGLPRKRYLFVYGGSQIGTGIAAVIRDYCKTHDLEFVSALTRCRFADRMYRSLTPFQWTELFRNAEATFILGTLHGTAYSVKYGKPFVLITNKATTQKVSTFLKEMRQDFRFFEPEEFTAEALGLLERSRHPAPSIPEEWRKTSLDFLEASLATAAARIA